MKIIGAVQLWHCWMWLIWCMCLICPRTHHWPAGPILWGFLSVAVKWYLRIFWREQSGKKFYSRLDVRIRSKRKISKRRDDMRWDECCISGNLILAISRRNDVKGRLIYQIEFSTCHSYNSLTSIQSECWIIKCHNPGGRGVQTLNPQPAIAQLRINPRDKPSSRKTSSQ